MNELSAFSAGTLPQRVKARGNFPNSIFMKIVSLKLLKERHHSPSPSKTFSHIKFLKRYERRLTPQMERNKGRIAKLLRVNRKKSMFLHEIS